MQLDRRSFLGKGCSALLAGAAATLASWTQRKAHARAQAPLPLSAKSRFARINGIRLHYVGVGSGPLLLLLHGWPETWLAWREVMPRLSQKFRVLAPDLRGVGLSERTEGGYDKRTIAEDLRQLILHAEVPDACVVGHDMGGKASYVLAHLHPDLVSKLVLVDCLVPGTENMDVRRGGAWHYGFHMAPEFPEMLTKGRERAYIRAQIKAWSHRKNAISEDVIAAYAKLYSGRGRMTAGFNYYRALGEDAEFAATLKGRKLAMPVMTIAGRHGVGSKLADAVAPEAERLTSIVVEDSGHFVPEEAPVEFCRHLEAFLAS